MTKCNKCNVYINTSVNKCPLCKNELSKDESFGDFKSNVYPFIGLVQDKHILKKTLGFICLLAIIVPTIFDLYFNHAITWSIFVDLAVACAALSVIIGIYKKSNLANILFYEYIFIVIMTYVWDKCTGMHNWSLTFVIPIVSSVFVVSNFILRLVLKKSLFRYFRSIAIGCVISLLCIFFYHYFELNVFIPSFIAGIIGIVILIFVLIFDGRKVLEELKARMYI